MKQSIYFANVLCILVITALFRLAIIYVEIPILEDYPPQLSDNNLTIGQWMVSFQKWAVFCVVSAGVASLLWYVLGQWVLNIDKWEAAGKRMLWVLLFLVPIITIIVSCIYVEKAESSLMLVYVFFFLNGLLPYYITTVLFSPLPVKYTPIFAVLIRSRCFW